MYCIPRSEYLQRIYIKDFELFELPIDKKYLGQSEQLVPEKEILAIEALERSCLQLWDSLFENSLKKINPVKVVLPTGELILFLAKPEYWEVMKAYK
jgi:hypothetical protein